MATPSNDDITHATVFNTTHLTEDTTGATEAIGEDLVAEAAQTIGKTVWFTYLAQTTGSVTIDTTGSSFDTTLQVFKLTNASGAASYSNLTELTSNDDNGTGNNPYDIAFYASTVHFNAVAGTTYYIQAGGGERGSDTEQGSLSLNASPAGGTPATGVTDPIFRFYDTVTNDHFYTTSAAEAASIKANLSTFTYEGTPWSTPEAGANTHDVFRFYDTVTKTHFLTDSTSERDTILKALPTLTYEGVAFEAYNTVENANEHALERFYNTNSHVHTYAADANEAALIKSGAVGQGWVDEGASFIIHV